MERRRVAGAGSGGRLARWARDLNARHPWSHNDAFHPWITTRLPGQRRDALDVGCGRGELLAVLAEDFDHVHGIDSDPGMRRAATARCAGLPNVRVDEINFDQVPAGVDLITMIAVLHHLDLATALEEVRRILRPGGCFLCVGLARPGSATDLGWEVASMVTNPLIGYVRHPWASSQPPGPAPFPVADPVLTFGEVRAVVRQQLPGAVMQHHLGFRHTIEWTSPDP